MQVDTLSRANESLESLMTAYAAGDDSAFDSLYRRVAPKLHRHLTRLSGDAALSEDVMQNTFVKVHRARSQYVAGAPVVPWLLVIARRTLLDEFRSARSRGEVLSDDGLLPEPALDTRSGIENALKLERALGELPVQYREAIVLTKVQGFSGDEAARALETTESAVKLRVHRGYRMLRDRLAEAA